MANSCKNNYLFERFVKKFVFSYFLNIGLCTKHRILSHSITRYTGLLSKQRIVIKTAKQTEIVIIR